MSRSPLYAITSFLLQGHVIFIPLGFSILINSSVYPFFKHASFIYKQHIIEYISTNNHLSYFNHCYLLKLRYLSEISKTSTRVFLKQIRHIA